MAYITRDDGERFIIPSYRDVLIAKKPSLLKREILLLSANYGEYITLQKKNAEQYEVAFSPEPGYLLGESIWYYFKKPLDLVYCEAIQNTSEAILVIVKNGSVYLDGSFPLDAIPEELVIFKTQQNNFDIFIYGDVPISKTLEEGKFSFDESSIKSFTILDSPVFPTLPTVKAFQLQLVDTVLKARGIGVFPIKSLLIFIAIVGLIWFGIDYLTSRKIEVPEAFVPFVNPYELYQQSLTSPEPSQEIQWLSNAIWQLATIPGWLPDTVNYSNGSLRVSVKSLGAKTTLLYDWASKNNAVVDISSDGFYITLSQTFKTRPAPTGITNLDRAVSIIIDNISSIIPGNNVDVGALNNKGQFSIRTINVKFSNISPTTLDLIGQQLKNLPLVLSSANFKITNGYLTGTLTLQALGT